MQELINFLSPYTNGILSSKRAGVFFNPQTYKKGNGLMVDAAPPPPPPPRPTMTFPVAVRFETSLVMTSYYGYEI